MHRRIPNLSRVFQAGAYGRPTVIPSSLLTSLNAFYKLDDATDSSANGNNLTNNNSTTFTSGKIGNAATFVSASNQSLTKASAIFTASGGYTISYWVKPSDSTRRGHVQWASSLAYGSAFTAYGTAVNFAINDGGFRNTTVARGANGTWSHVVVRFDSAAGTYGTMYYSVRPSGSSANTGSYVLTGAHPGVDMFGIGFAVDSNADGQIDAVGVWSRCLTQSEIDSLYNSGNGLEYSF